MVMANSERVGKALVLLRDGLGPACEATWRRAYGDDWLQRVNSKLRRPEKDPSIGDVAFLCNGVKATWDELFSRELSPEVRNWVFEVANIRNRWAHQDKDLSPSSDDVLRGLDSMERLLEVFGNTDEREQIHKLRHGLMRQVFDEASRGERRRAAAQATGGTPQSTLTPWRDIITPHQDVASGNFVQAEYAADLWQVARGGAEAEYQDPREFFARTYITQGLRDLLTGAAKRLAGKGGDPVIELQTNFGGGKTHSLIALYHLASGTSANTLPGLGEVLAEENISLPRRINRAVLVGQRISPARPHVADDDTVLHTLWGRLAHQLGGKEGYDLVRDDDVAGTSPGDALTELFERFGPAVVLIDEWVAYARQLFDRPTNGEGQRLAGGDFDTQFTFAQALTEAAAAVPNVVVLVAIPESQVEVGGPRGRTALEKLKNVVTRTAAQWQPASPDESFEIVRRRLFDPIPDEKAKVRDTVIYGFSGMYGDQGAEFPPGVAEIDYRNRMKQCYPIHPELFDRLFDDWSALDKFQRTRGVLRLMALAISELWKRNDQSLLIMPGNLPMDFGPLVSEMKKYLEDGWDPVIKSDVDGATSLPLSIDTNTKHFGRLSATRRAARTVYMGSAPRPDGKQGVDLKSVVLGCAQPGEPPQQFADALRRLSGQATHLYVDGALYWYSLNPNVTRIAEGRASSNFDDRDADDEARARIAAQRDRGSFAAVQVFAAGPGDVPDNDDGVRLVILEPNATHSQNDANSPAVALANRILAQRHGGQRLNRNLVLFAAAAANRLPELRGAARLYLAWQSIVADESLDLTTHQKRQAQTKLAETSKQVDSLIAETFILVLVPSQRPGTAEVVWQTIRANSAGDIAARISRKLASEEQLIAAYHGRRVRMDLDRVDLWSERGDIAVHKLWETYARFLHMPRLASRDVLYDAIADRATTLDWLQDTFAYAESHDGNQWQGMHTDTAVAPEPSGLLIHPDMIPEPEPPQPTTEDPPGGTSDPPEPPGGDPQPASAAALPTDFYAQFRLDLARCINQIHSIVENVGEKLGDPDVELTLEIRATNQQGFNESTQRTVSENARNLKAESSEFE